MGIKLFVLASAAIAFLINLLITPIILRFSHKFKWYDEKDHRKIHTGDIPRLGGVGIYGSFIITIVIALLFFSKVSPELLLEIKWYRYAILAIGLTSMHLVGLVDDFSNLRPRYKLFLQIVAASVATIGTFGLGHLSLPFLWNGVNLGFLAYPVTVFWIIAIANAVNLVDGMDGLAGGISCIAALFLGILGLLQGQFFISLAAFIFFGTLLGFLVFNFPPAKIFMGDSGSLTLGYLLAVIPFLDSSGFTTSPILVPVVTLLMLPILDTIAAMIRRALKQKPIHSPDRLHIHHKLLDKKYSARKILLIIYSICLALGAASLTWHYLDPNISMGIITCTWIAVIVWLLKIDIFDKKQKV